MKRENIKRGGQIDAELFRLETNHKHLIAAELDVVFLIFSYTDEQKINSVPIKMQLTKDEADIIMCDLIEFGQNLSVQLKAELEAL